MPYQPSTHISPLAFGPWANMGVSGWYDMWYEKCHIRIYNNDFMDVRSLELDTDMYQWKLVSLIFI
jgi:hypothetical protein